jgi:Mycothiol maleylpyruvate isomerase N-terminal domain
MRSTSLRSWQRQALRRIVAGRRETLAFIARLPEPEIRRARTQDRWSVKDVLAHLLACDEETNRRLRLIARGQADRIQWFESMAYADRFNARTVGQLRRLGLPALRRRMQRAHTELIRRLERLPAAAFDDPSHEYPLVEWLPAPGWSHERDHIGEAKAWWRTRQKELARRPRRQA